MANPKLPPGAVSKRSLTTTFGLNSKHTRTLLRVGVLSLLGPGISAESLGNLEEGEHYVLCRVCSARMAAITPKHLASCSGLSLGQYVARYPDSQVTSTMTATRRQRSEAQRERQSITLKRRFQTAAGEVTREQIRTASKRLMQTPYRMRAATHLREYNTQHRAEISALLLKRWQDPKYRATMLGIARKRLPLLQAAAAHARGYLTKTFTQPHRALEEALLAAGVQGLIREHVIGYYRVDEAIPAMKVAFEVDGCYWHGCDHCGFSGVPGTRMTDKRKMTYLLNLGWRVYRVPEHRIKGDLATVVAEILEVCRG